MSSLNSNPLDSGISDVRRSMMYGGGNTGYNNGMVGRNRGPGSNFQLPSAQQKSIPQITPQQSGYNPGQALGQLNDAESNTAAQKQQAFSSWWQRQQAMRQPGAVPGVGASVPGIGNNPMNLLIQTQDGSNWPMLGSHLSAQASEAQNANAYSGSGVTSGPNDAPPFRPNLNTQQQSSQPQSVPGIPPNRAPNAYQQGAVPLMGAGTGRLADSYHLPSDQLNQFGQSLGVPRGNLAAMGTPGQPGYMPSRPLTDDEYEGRVRAYAQQQFNQNQLPKDKGYQSALAKQNDVRESMREMVPYAQYQKNQTDAQQAAQDKAFNQQLAMANAKVPAAQATAQGREVSAQTAADAKNKATEAHSGDVAATNQNRFEVARINNATKALLGIGNLNEKSYKDWQDGINKQYEIKMKDADEEKRDALVREKNEILARGQHYKEWRDTNVQPDGTIKPGAQYDPSTFHMPAQANPVETPVAPGLRAQPNAPTETNPQIGQTAAMNQPQHGQVMPTRFGTPATFVQGRGWLHGDPKTLQSLGVAV